MNYRHWCENLWCVPLCNGQRLFYSQQFSSDQREDMHYYIFSPNHDMSFFPQMRPFRSSTYNYNWEQNFGHKLGQSLSKYPHDWTWFCDHFYNSHKVNCVVKAIQLLQWPLFCWKLAKKVTNCDHLTEGHCNQSWWLLASFFWNKHIHDVHMTLGFKALHVQYVYTGPAPGLLWLCLCSWSQTINTVQEEWYNVELVYPAQMSRVKNSKQDIGLDNHER